MHSVGILSRYRTIADKFVSRWSTDNRPIVIRCLSHIEKSPTIFRASVDHAEIYQYYRNIDFPNSTQPFNFTLNNLKGTLIRNWCERSFLPQIRIAVDLFKQTSHEDLGLEHTLTMALMFLNTLANPFIYVACRRRYRRSLLRVFCFGQRKGITRVYFYEGTGTSKPVHTLRCQGETTVF